MWNNLKGGVYMGLFEQFPYTNYQSLNLGWVLQQIDEWYNALETKIPEIEAAITALQEMDRQQNVRLDTLEKELASIIDDDTILKLVIDAIGQAIKMVFFGLTDDGYFVAYIPDSWKDFTFDTIMDLHSDDFGKLVIIY